MHPYVCVPDGTMRIWNIDTGECLDILYPMEVFAEGMDFSRAIIPPELANKLRQNRAKVPEQTIIESNHSGGNEK